MYTMKLDWKEFSVNLAAVETWLKANAEHYAGNQAHNCLELWFTEEPSQEIKDAVQAYWDGLEDDSEEATSYVSATALEAERLAKKESGKAKLIALGLTEEEAAALVG